MKKGASNNKAFKIEDHIPDEEEINRMYNNEQVNKAREQVKEQLHQNLVIAFFGTVSSGKSSAIKALFNKDPGDISPIPGSTKQVKVFQISENFCIVDAPGFRDVHQETSNQAKKIVDDVDVYVYMLNAEGGFKEPEKDDLHELMKKNRPVLVVLNKIDLIRPDQQKMFIDHQMKSIGVEQENFIPAAFDPLPQISTEPINLDKVQKWISDVVEKNGKQLIFAKHVRRKDEECEKIIEKNTAVAFAIGALPLPGSDFIPLTALQVKMIYSIAAVYEIPNSDPQQFIKEVLITGKAGKQVYRWILSALKPFGGPLVSVIAGGIAASFTYGLGQSSKVYYKSGMTMPIYEVAKIFEERYKEHRKGAESVK